MRRLMEYRIVSGRTVEIRRSWISTARDYHKPRGHRRAGSSSAAKMKANERDCVRRLARLINCNFEAGDAQVALKYDDLHYPGEYETAKAVLTKKFLPMLRKEYRKVTGKNLQAVWVTANWSPKKEAPARLHHHIVLQRDATEMARKIWEERFGGLGSFAMESLDGRGDHTDLAAYMAANVHGRPAGENKWSACRGMKQPIYEEPVEVKDVEDIQPIYLARVHDVSESRDEDGRIISKYMRCTLPERPKIRGGQIIYPRRQGRKRNE